MRSAEEPAKLLRNAWVGGSNPSCGTSRTGFRRHDRLSKRWHCAGFRAGSEGGVKVLDPQKGIGSFRHSDRLVPDPTTNPCRDRARIPEAADSYKFGGDHASGGSSDRRDVQPPRSSV
jgi:hypothetical protein